MKEKYLIPVSIIIAGFLIALAVILSPLIWQDENQGSSKESVSNNTQEVAEAKKQLEELLKKFRMPDKTDWVRGDLEKAQVIFVEYSDLECPFCKKFHETMKKIIEKYNDKVAWIYRHLPLENLHSKAIIESIAAECVGSLGGNKAFWNYIDKIFEITPSNNGLDLNLLPQLAKEVNVSLDNFQNCFTQRLPEQKIRSQIKEAFDLGIQGTPFTLIIFGDQKIPLPGYVDFETLDNNLLSKIIK